MAGHSLRVRIDPDTEARVDDSVELFFALAKAHVFDAETEEAIC